MPRQPEPRFKKSAGRWYANVGERGSDGRAREVYAPPEVQTKPDAWRWFEALIQANTPRAVAPDRITVATVVDSYLVWCEGRRDAGHLTPTHHTSKGYHGSHFANRFGARAVASLTAKEVTEWLEGLTAVYSVNYTANIASTVSACLNWSVREGRIDRNPVAGFTCPTVPKSPERYAERAEAAAFLRCWRRVADEAGPVGRRYHRLTILLQRMLIRTGARPGELCSLWWGDVKWEAGRTSSGHPFAKFVIPPERWKSGAKTGKPRTIFVSPALTRALRREFDRPDRVGRNVFLHGRGRGGIGAGEPWADGSRLSQAVLKVRRRLHDDQAEARRAAEAGEDLTTYERAILRLELPDAGPQRITNYRWRHTAVSTMLMLGVDVPTIAELCGTSQEMISRIYGHLLTGHLARAAETLHSKKLAG